MDCKKADRTPWCGLDRHSGHKNPAWAKFNSPSLYKGLAGGFPEEDGGSFLPAVS